MDANNPYYVVVADKSSQLLLLAIHVLHVELHAPAMEYLLLK
jgi:hypothetical protein